jgi:iron(III) transport system substrate-binding protein
MVRLWLKAFLAPVATYMALAASPVHAQMAPWEKSLYEAAKSEKPVTVYTAHYSTEEAAGLCGAYEKKYPGLKCNFVRTTAQVAFQRLQQDMQANARVASVFSSTDVSHYRRSSRRGCCLRTRRTTQPIWWTRSRRTTTRTARIG